MDEKCTRCGGDLKKEIRESSLAEDIYYCSNPECKGRFAFKTSLGKVAPVAAVFSAGAIIFKILEDHVDNLIGNIFDNL